MIDRYTKFVLTVIAGALLYLAVIFTPLPAVNAQTPRMSRANRAGPPRSWSSAGRLDRPSSPSRSAIQCRSRRQSRCRSPVR